MDKKRAHTSRTLRRIIQSVVASPFMAALCLWGGVAACATHQAGGGAEDADIPYATLERGQQSRIMNLECASIESETAWRELLERHLTPSQMAARSASGAEDPDFSRESVFAVFLGQRNTSGYAVEITNVHATDGRVDIRYREQTPDLEHMVGMVITSPYHIIRTRKLGLPANCLPEPFSGFSGAQGPGAKQRQ